MTVSGWAVDLNHNLHPNRSNLLPQKVTDARCLLTIQTDLIVTG